jgi:RHS repeat-associated protein
MTDEAGNIAWSASYKAWGEAKELIGKAANKAGFKNPLRFQGQYLDHETGLHYNRFRYYDPETGRFISKDPIGFAGGLNVFQYAPNPMEWVDPFGLQKCPCDSPCLDGGSFQAMDAKARQANKTIADSNKELVGHHIPQNAHNKTIGVTRNDGPAILMTKEAHAETRTFRGKGKGAMNRDKAANMNARQRMAADIRDLRQLHGSKCNAAALKAIAYAKTRPEFKK